MVEDTPVKMYTLEEVREHDGKNGKDVWIVIKDNVYDVTNYLDDHPAGKEVIIEFAGKDATKDFGAAGHSSDAKKELKTFKIGEIVEEERKKKIEKTGTTEAIDNKKNIDVKNRRSCISIITCGICRFS